jgi:hypothetical protein
MFQLVYHYYAKCKLVSKNSIGQKTYTHYELDGIIVLDKIQGPDNYIELKIELGKKVPGEYVDMVIMNLNLV